MIINKAFADKYFPNEDPIGKHVAFLWEIDGFQEVIGVIANVKHDNLSSPENREIYVSYAQRPDSGFTIALRTKNDPGAMVSAVRSELASLDPSLPIAHVSTLDEVVSISVRDPPPRLPLTDPLRRSDSVSLRNLFGQTAGGSGDLRRPRRRRGAGAGRRARSVRSGSEPRRRRASAPGGGSWSTRAGPRG